MSSSSNSAIAEVDRRACPRCRAVFRQSLACCPRDGEALVTMAHDPLVGTVLAGRYSVVECIGEGGMGRVYRAEHESLPRPFAIKVLFGDLAADENMRARFGREAAAAASLNHRNIAAITDFGETDGGLLFIAMELVSGTSLSELVRSAGPLPDARVCDIVTQIAAGLDHAHRRGLVHRDLKSENILVAHDGDEDVVKIVDFGIALALERDAERRLTQDGLVVGTPDIMSPEQLTGGDVDHRADLFALGVVNYEMMAGRVPFDGSAMEVAQKNLSSKPPAVAEYRSSGAPAPEIEAIAMRLMEKRPQDRYQSAKEVARAVEEARAAINGRPPPPLAPFGSDEEISVAHGPTLEIARRSGSPGPVAALIVLAVVALAALVYLRWPVESKPSSAPSEQKAESRALVDASIAVSSDVASLPNPAAMVDAAPVGEVDAAPRRETKSPRPRSKAQGAAKKGDAQGAKEEDVYESRY